MTELRAGDVRWPVPIDRGDVTVHSEGVLHGSGGNASGLVARRRPTSSPSGRRARSKPSGRWGSRTRTTTTPRCSSVDGLTGPVERPAGDEHHRAQGAITSTCTPPSCSRIRGSDALEACQKLLQALMDSSANAVFWKDLQSRYLGCNRVFAAFAGSSPTT